MSGVSTGGFATPQCPMCRHLGSLYRFGVTRANERQRALLKGFLETNQKFLSGSHRPAADQRLSLLKLQLSGRICNYCPRIRHLPVALMQMITQMGYVVVATPNVPAAAADLADIVGLKVTTRSDDAILLSSNARSCEVAFVQAHDGGIRAIGLEASDAASVDEISRRVVSEGCTVIADKPSIPKVQRAVRFRSKFGPIIEVHTPVEREALKPMNNPGARARRLDHVNVRVNDPHGFYEFMTRVLGMRLSDRTADYSRAWYRAADGFHHTIAAGPGEGLHHYGFDAH
jgi:Glyoxalase/Bleomycin resistance protein/Dioxygenase superfamily